MAKLQSRTGGPTRWLAEDWTRDGTRAADAQQYEFRKRRLAARAGKIEDAGYEDQSLAYQQMVQLVLQARQRARRCCGWGEPRESSNE